MCDATEVFVLLAGYGAGLSYGMGLGRQGYISTAADVLKRAWTLYIAHIFLFMLFSAQVTYSATLLNRINYLEESRLDILGDDPYRSILEALLLRFQPSLLNILPLYVALMVFLAATIWLLRWPRVLFGLSFCLYMLVRFTSLNLTAWSEEGWFFDPFAWQFLFIIGVLLACAPPRMPSRKSLFDGLAVITVLTGMVVTTGHRAGPASAGTGHGIAAAVPGDRGQDRPLSVPLAVDPGADMAVRPLHPLRSALAALPLGSAAGAARAEFAAGVLRRHRAGLRRPHRAGI